MNSLLHNIRFYVLLFSLLLSFWLLFSYPDTYQRAQINGITAVIFLYFALLAGPLTRVFPRLPFRASYIKMRRALGVSAFYFALLHLLSTIDYMGGINVILEFITQGALPLLAGLISFIILLFMALTSFDVAVRVITFPKWKFLHRFVYVVEILIVYHMFILGHHFLDRASLMSLIAFGALAVLITLQLWAFVKQKARSSVPTPQT